MKRLIEKPKGLNDPPLRIETIVVDKPILKFPNNIRMSKDEEIYLDVLSDEVVKFLLEMPKGCVTWKPEKYVFEETHHTPILVKWMGNSIENLEDNIIFHLNILLK